MLWAGVALAYLLHDDFWLRDDTRTIAGLPAGLAYHVGYCLFVAVLMALLVRHAWPRRLDAGDDAL